jgi:hypothetical protein
MQAEVSERGFSSEAPRCYARASNSRRRVPWTRQGARRPNCLEKSLPPMKHLSNFYVFIDEEKIS